MLTQQLERITARPLTESQLRQRAPSIFAVEAHGSRSDRFAPIPTFELVQRIMAAGFVPVDARQSRTRDESKIAFTKHMVRFRPADAGALAVGDTVPECLLINGNDGSSAYKTLSAMTRLICLNGMTIPTRKDSEFSIPHKGKDIAGRVIDATFETVRTATRALEAAKYSLESAFPDLIGLSRLQKNSTDCINTVSPKVKHEKPLFSKDLLVH